MQHERQSASAENIETDDAYEHEEGPRVLQKEAFEMYRKKCSLLYTRMNDVSRMFPEDEADALLDELEQYLEIQRSIYPDSIDISIHELFAVLLKTPTSPPGARHMDPAWHALYEHWRERVEDTLIYVLEENATALRPHIEHYAQDPVLFHRTMGHLPSLLTSQPGLALHPALKDLISVTYPHARARLRAYGTLNMHDASEHITDEEYAGLEDMYTALCAVGNDEAVDDITDECLDPSIDRLRAWNILHNTLLTGCWQALQPEQLEGLNEEQRVARIEEHHESEYTKPGVRMTAAMLKAYHLDPERCMHAWDMPSLDAEESATAYLRHLYTIREIEAKEEGGAWLLNERFGIQHFGRYPHELLFEQLEHADDAEVPYGVILTPERDHNGAFMGRIHEKAAVHDSADNLGLHTRVIEVGSLMDLARRLLALEKIYGEERIEFGYVEGHGEPGSIQLGDRPRDLVTSEVLGQASDRCSLFFKQGAPLMLESCSTGARRGVASALSSKLGTEVTAPTKPSYGIPNLALTRDDTGTLRFQGKHNFQTGERGATVRYKSGRRPAGDVARATYEKVFGVRKEK